MEEEKRSHMWRTHMWRTHMVLVSRLITSSVSVSGLFVQCIGVKLCHSVQFKNILKFGIYFVIRPPLLQCACGGSVFMTGNQYVKLVSTTLKAFFHVLDSDVKLGQKKWCMWTLLIIIKTLKILTQIIFKIKVNI